MVVSKKSEETTANAILKDFNNINMNSFNVRNNTNYQTLRATQTNNARTNKVNNLIAKFSGPSINYDVSNFHHQSNDIKNSKLAPKQDTEFISLSTWPFHNNFVSNSKNKSIGNHIQTTSHHYTSPVYSSSRLPQFVTSHKSSTDSHENTPMNTSKTLLKNNNHKQTESVNIIEVYDESKFGLAALRKNKSSIKQTYNGNNTGVPLQDNTPYDDNSIIGLAALKKRNDCPISTRPNDIALNVPVLPNNSDSKRNSLNEDSDSNNNAVTPTPSTSSNFYVQTFKSTLNNNILFGKSRVGNNIILNNSQYQSQDITVSERGKKSDPTVHKVQHVNGEINNFSPQNDKNASIMTKASQLSGYTQENTYSSLNSKMCPPDKFMNHGKNDHIIATTADKTDNIGNENTPTSLHCRQASEDSTTSSFSSLLLIVSGGKPPPPQFTTQFNSALTNDVQNKSYKLSPSNQDLGHETHPGNSIDNSLLYTTMITSSYSSSASTSSLLSSARDSNNSNDESSGKQKIHKVMPKPHAMPKTNNPNLDEVDNLCDSMAKKELKHCYENYNDDYNDSIIYIQNNLHKADSHTPNHAQRSSTLNGKQYMGSHSTPNAMILTNDNQQVDKILSPSPFEANAPPPLSPLSLTSPKLDIMEETQNKYSSFYNGLTHNGIKLSPLVTNCSPTSQLNKNNINSGNAIKHNLFMMNKSSNTILTANYNNVSNQTTANNTLLNSNISRSESRGSIASLTSIVSLASSTSYLSPHELQQLIDEANLTIDHTGATDQIIEVIILHREHMGGGIGITLAGGIDQEQKEIRIHKVISGSVADKDGRAFKGDRVLSINGKTLFNLTHRQSVEILKAPRPEVVLVLSRSKLSRLGQQAMFESTQNSGIKLEKNDDAENYIFNKLSNMQQNSNGTESPINNNSNNHSTFNNCDHLSSDSSERSCYQKLVFHQHINKNNSLLVTKLETTNNDIKDINSIQNDSKFTNNNNKNIATQNKYENIVERINNQEEVKVDKISSSITVELCNNSSALSCGSLGFSLEGGVASLEGDKPLTVKRIFKGGPIDRCGQNILPGYQLLCVNGEHLNGLTLFQAWNLIKNLPQGQNVSLTFLPKNPTNTNVNLPN